MQPEPETLIPKRQGTVRPRWDRTDTQSVACLDAATKPDATCAVKHCAHWKHYQYASDEYCEPKTWFGACGLWELSLLS